MLRKTFEDNKNNLGITYQIGIVRKSLNMNLGAYVKDRITFISVTFCITTVAKSVQETLKIQNDAYFQKIFDVLQTDSVAKNMLTFKKDDYNFLDVYYFLGCSVTRDYMCLKANEMKGQKNSKTQEGNAE